MRDEIYIGADSKVFSGTPKASRCKITQANSVFITVAGFATWKEFDIPLIAKKACLLGGSASKKVDAFEALVKDPLANALSDIRAVDYSAFQRLIEPSDPDSAICNVAFLGFENGKPFCLVRKIRLTNAMQTLSISKETLSIPPNANVFFKFWGKGNPDLNYLLVKREITLPLRMRRIIKAQAVLYEESVGEPIDILRITKIMASWIDKPKGSKCQKIRPYWK